MNVVERIAPKTLDELSQLLGECDRSGRKIAIHGGDTLAGYGLPVQSAAIELSTVELGGIVEYERADLTIAARAGTSLRSIAQLLASAGQFVPFDAPRMEYATLGGTLAAGWLGPRRHLYGRPRDYVLGSTIVLADGSVARAGGMVVKNVAGYDMSRLYVGSFGTLGVLERANLKTLAMPAKMRAFLAPLPEGTRERAFAHLSSLPVLPSAAFCIEGFHQSIDGDDGQEGRLVVLLEGSPAVLERATRDLRSSLGRAGVPETRVVDSGARETFERVVDAYVNALGERSITYRVHGDPGGAYARMAALAQVARDFQLHFDGIADALNGDVVARLSDLDMRSLGGKIEMLDDAVHALEPRAQVVACNHPHRPYLQVWGELPAAIDRMRELKRRFDPNGTLNPGKYVGAI